MLKFGLRIYDGEKPKLNELLNYSHLFWRTIGVSLLFVLISFIALWIPFMILFVSRFLSITFQVFALVLFFIGLIAFVYLVIKYIFSYIFVVDKNLGVVESFKKSSEITKGNKWHIFAFWIVLVALNILGLLCF